MKNIIKKIIKKILLSTGIIASLFISNHFLEIKAQVVNCPTNTTNVNGSCISNNNFLYSPSTNYIRPIVSSSTINPSNIKISTTTGNVLQNLNGLFSPAIGGGSATNTLTGNNANNSLTLSDTNGNSTSTVVQVGEVYRKSTSTISILLAYSLTSGGFAITNRTFDIVGGINGSKNTYTQNITATQNSNVFTITGTLPATMVPGNYIEINNTAPIYKIVSTTGNNVTVNRNYTGATQTFSNYEVFTGTIQTGVYTVSDFTSYQNAMATALVNTWKSLNSSYNLSFTTPTGFNTTINGSYNATNSVPVNPIGEIYVVDITSGLTSGIDANFLLYNQNQNNPSVWSPAYTVNLVAKDIIDTEIENQILAGNNISISQDRITKKIYISSFSSSTGGIMYGLPLDVISWNDDVGNVYVSNTSFWTFDATTTSPASPYVSGSQWSFNVGTLFPVGLSNGTQLLGTDASGRTVSGVYTMGSPAYIQQTRPDRIAGGGFSPNTIYPMKWRAGIPASASFWSDSGTAGIGNFKINTLSPGNNITLTRDINNPGRYVISTSQGSVSGSGEVGSLTVWKGLNTIGTTTLTYNNASNTINFGGTTFGSTLLGNIYLGNWNLLQNINGEENLSLGNYNLWQNQTGSYNSFLGNASGYNNISGMRNNGVGNSSLISLRNGNSNNALGYNSLPGLQTGSFNIGIGDNVDVASSTGDYQLNIGNWIYGNQGNISIGSPTAPYKTNATKFQVEGATTLNGDVVITGTNFKAKSSILGNTGTTPRQLTMDSAGNIYTANYDGNNVTKITPAGATSTLGTTGVNPFGIAVDSNGNVYTANSSGGSITKITPAGASTTFTTGLYYPWGLTIDSSNNLYATSYFGNFVYKISATGSSSVAGTTGANPYNVIVGNDGYIYTTNFGSSSVSKINPTTGTSTILGNTGSLPYGLVMDTSGNIYTANDGDGTVSKITPAGISTTFARTGGKPRGIVLDGKGKLYVTETQNDLIIIVDIATGATSTLITANASVIDPFGLVIDTNTGTLYSGNAGSNNVSKIVQPYYSKYLTTDSLGNLIYSSSNNNINDSEITLYSDNTTKPSSPVSGIDFNITQDGKVVVPLTGGNTWTKTNKTTGTFIYLLNTGTQIIGGTNNGIWKSTDGGNNWSQTSQTTGTFNSLLSIGTQILGASNAGIWKSTDNGNTWTQTSQATGTFLSLLNTGSSLFAGSYFTGSNNSGGIWKSTDGGNTWTQILQSNGSFYSIFNTGDQLLSGGNAFIYKSTDGGNTWATTSRVGRVSSFLNTGSQLLASSAFLSGTSPSGIYKSTDGGNTWVLAGLQYTDIGFLGNAGSFVIAGSVDGTGIYKSLDGGNTWTPTSQNTGFFYSFLNTGSQLLAGDAMAGGVWKSSLQNWYPIPNSYTTNWKSTVRFTATTTAKKYDTIVSSVFSYDPASIEDSLLEVTDSTTTNSTRIQSKNKQNTCIGNTLTPEVVCAKIEVVPTFYQTSGLNSSINRAYYNPKNGYYVYSTLNQGLQVNLNPKTSSGYTEIPLSTIFGPSNTGYSIGDMIFAPNGELFVIGYFAQNVLVSKLSFSAGTIQPTTVKISQVFTPTGLSGFSYQSIEDLAVLQTGTDLYTIGFVGTTLNPNDSYLVKAVDLNTTGASIVASNTRNYFNGATYGYTFWNAIEFDTTGRLTLAGNTRIISYYAGQTPVEIWRNPDLSGPTNQDIYSDGTSVYWAVSDGNVYHTTYANPTTDLVLYPKTTTGNTVYSNVYGIGLDASSTLYQMFYGTRSASQNNYFVTFSKNDTTSISGVLDLSSTTKIVNLDTFIPAPIKRMSIFTLTETTASFGSGLFTLGTNGGSVGTFTNNVNIQPPTATGTSGWIIPAGIWDITVSANYTGTSQGAETIITKFGVDSSITGAGNANNLYFTPSKTQTGSDAIAGTHEQFFNFSSPTTFYLTRFAGSAGTVGSAQISPNNDFQISFSKLD